MAAAIGVSSAYLSALEHGKRGRPSWHVTTIKATASDDSMSVLIPVTTELTPGSYLITWRTASRDGHAIRGTFGFSIAP